MKPTEQLADEHRAVKLMLKILKRACDKMHGGAPIPHEHLRQMAGFLTGFVDACHHAKEEEVLFPALLAARIPGIEERVRAMADEHRRGRVLSAGFADAATRCRAGDHRSPAKVIAAACAYRDLMIRHIEREEATVFAAAEEGLPADRHGAILDGFERIVEKKLGAGEHGRLRDTLRRLQQVYVRE